MSQPPSNFKVVAIDPGTTHSAIVAWDGQEIKLTSFVENEKVLQLVSNLAFSGFTHLAVEEMVIYQRCDRNMFLTIMNCGRIIERWNCSLVNRDSGTLHLISRMTYVAGLIGTCGMANKDGAIRSYLIDRFGHPGDKRKPNPEAITYGLDVWVPDLSPKAKPGKMKRKNDCWQAFALAVYVHDQLTFQQAAA
jgi:hypothetical protein